MTSQTMNSSQQIVGVFKDRQSALKVQQAIQSAGISAQQVSIDDHISPQTQVAAIGTTIGGEAGFWMGAFYGGILGVIAVAIIGTLQQGHPYTSDFTRLLVIGFTIGGAVLGSISGKGILASQPLAQKKKGDPDLPRTFRLLVRGSQNEINEARRVVRETGI